MEFLSLQDVPRHSHTAIAVNRVPSRREGREHMSIRDITTPRNVESRQELPPISELFQTVDSSTRRPDHNNYSLERRENGIYAPQPGPYQYQPRYDRRSSLRAEYEPRIAVGEQYSRNVAVASSHDGHSHPGHHHAPPFAREAHVHPHAPQVQHVMAPYPYPGGYYESQYPHPPNVFFHAESGQYVQAWSGGEGNPHDPYAGRKRRGNLPKEATNLLKRWFADHGDSPYPSEEEKQNLSIATGLGLNQISNWFINARRRQPGRDAREALLREQELRKEQLSRQQQSQSGASSQLSSTPSPTDDSTSSGSVASSIEQDRRHSRYDAPGRSSPPRTRSTAGMSSPYSSGAATRHSERHAALHRSSRRSSTPESRRERRHM
ncbi:hypothetical protein IWX49DRAFT_290129 [Phyllosticta citricarpa]|uniref:Homeobox domain-containing protein n=1 Tax=Phyllosticta paracitricarpa TaxID=2016321 RepID=A0ABR1NII1_9PEZI